MEIESSAIDNLVKACIEEEKENEDFKQVLSKPDKSLTKYLNEKVFNETIKGYLQKKEEKQRMKTMKLLRNDIVPYILKTLQNCTDEDHTDLLLSFLNDVILELFEKVRDIYCVLDSLEIIHDLLLKQGLQIEAVKTLFTADFVKKLLQTVSSPNLHVPQYNFKTRNQVYRIYEVMSIELLSKLDGMLFVSCVLSSIETEGDPRNLMLVFDLIFFILVNFATEENTKEMDPFLEDIFDKLSCYFPINFTPPKDDPYKITPELLKSKLTQCFLANQSKTLTENSFPFFLDKLTESDLKTKSESLQILKSMIEKFEMEKVQGHLDICISAMMNEYFNRFEAEVQIEMKTALASIINTIEQKLKFSRAKGGVYYSTALSSHSLGLIDKCFFEIGSEPDGMTAFLGSQMLGELAKYPTFNRDVLHRIITSFESAKDLAAHIQMFCSVLEQQQTVDGIKGKDIRKATIEFLQGKKPEMELIMNRDSTQLIKEKSFKLKVQLIILGYEPMTTAFVSDLLRKDEELLPVVFQNLKHIPDTSAHFQPIQILLIKFMTENQEMQKNVLSEEGLMRGKDFILWALENDQIEHIVSLTDDPKVADDPEIQEKLLANLKSNELNWKNKKIILKCLNVAKCQEILDNQDSAGIKVARFIVKYKQINTKNIEEKMPALTKSVTPEDAKQLNKLAFYVILRSKESPFLDVNDPADLQFFILKAYLMLGKKEAFTKLTQLHESLDAQVYAELFLQIIAKPPSSSVSRANGHKVSKMFSQKLFAVFYPIFIKSGNQSLLMGLCSMVSLNILQNKLDELMPIAVGVLSERTQIEDHKIKYTALQLLRKILMQAGSKQASVDQKERALGYLEVYINAIADQLNTKTTSLDLKTEITTKIECIYSLTVLMETYPAIELQKYTARVEKALKALLSHKKRAVRKFARNCLNEWIMM